MLLQKVGKTGFKHGSISLSTNLFSRIECVMESIEVVVLLDDTSDETLSWFVLKMRL